MSETPEFKLMAPKGDSMTQTERTQRMLGFSFLTPSGVSRHCSRHYSVTSNVTMAVRV